MSIAVDDRELVAPERAFFDERQSREILGQTRQFTQSSAWRATWQLGSTIACFVALLALASRIGPSWPLICLVPWVAGTLVRSFVLQHDLGHRSLFTGKRLNDALGFCVSLITSVPFEAWRTEHSWHHNHQGKLSKRGVDNMNSPMTIDEVPHDLPQANYRVRKVSPRNVFLIGAYSLLVERRFAKGFFPFRERFVDPVHNAAQMRRGIAMTLPLHLGLQLLVGWALGWWVSALVWLPAAVIAAGTGGLLFWVQHNFEQGYYARDGAWNRANVAVFGSSYLKLAALLRWFTADIGLHHVHHLNPRIPNYALERARQQISALAAVEPLKPEDLSKSFTHLFWDEQARRFKAPAELDVAGLERR